MALLVANGFDIYDSATVLNQEAEWDSSRYGLVLETAAGRFGGGNIELEEPSGDNIDRLALILLSEPSTIFFGCSFRVDIRETAWSEPVIEMSGNGVNMHFVMDYNTGKEKYDVIVAGATLGEVTISDYMWHRLEIKMIISDTVGECTIRLNDQEVFTRTGIDTLSGTDAFVRIIEMSGEATGNNGVRVRLDDIVVTDDTGPAPNNTFLGDIRISALRPNAPGDATDFTPLAGTNWEAVDDTLGSDGDTTYVESTTAAHQDLHNIEPITGVGELPTTIYGFVVSAHCKKTEAGVRSIQLLSKSGVTTGNGATQVLLTTYTTIHEIFELNPDTSVAWTVSDIDSAQIGVENV